MFGKIYTTVINILFVYIAWLACVDGASHGYFYWPSLITLFLLSMYFFIGYYYKWIVSKSDLKVVLIACITGFLVESFFISSKLLVYQGNGIISAYTPPFWIITIYAILVMSFNHSGAKLKDHLIFASIFGFIGAFVAYGSGAKIGAVAISEPYYQSMFVVAFVWACIFPFLLWVAKKTHRESH